MLYKPIVPRVIELIEPLDLRVHSIKKNNIKVQLKMDAKGKEVQGFVT